MARVALFRIAIVRLAIVHCMAGKPILDELEIDVSSCLQMPPQAAQDPADGCGLEFVTTFFTTRLDWQRNRSAPPVYDMMGRYFKSGRKQQINATIIYDQLPQEILQYGDDQFKFVQVNISEYNMQEGMNDMRFSIIDDVVKQHPEWRSIFLTDLFDAKVAKNPCGHMSAGKLYVGSEEGEKLRKNQWMKKRYLQMGGKYLAFFQQAPRPWVLLSAGIVGGDRDVFSRFLAEMRTAISDPELTVRVTGEQENVNMAAFNYVVRQSMGLEENNEDGQPGFVTGAPVHSMYKEWQNDREDVWVIHK